MTCKTGRCVAVACAILGYSRGNGRAPRAGERFDGYEPIDCDEVQVRLGELDSFDFPNWT